MRGSQIRLRAGAILAVVTLAGGVLSGLGTPAAVANPNIVVVPGSFSLNAISCTSPAFCLSVGGFNGTSVMTEFVNGIEGGVIPIAGQMTLTAMACPSASTCYAVGNTPAVNPPHNADGVVVPIVYGIAGTPIVIPGTEVLTSIACDPGTTTCVAVGSDTTNSPNPPYSFGTVVPLNNGVPSGPVEDETGFLSLAAVACPAPGSCLAAGTALGPTSTVGGLLPVTGGAAGAPTTDSDVFGFSTLACTDATRCLAAGGGASGPQVLAVSAGVPGPATAVTAVAGFSSATCPTVTQCYLTGQTPGGDGYVLPVTSGVPGTAQVALPAGFLYGLTCVGATQCIGVGSERSPVVGVIVTSAAPSPPAAISSVSFSGSGYSTTVTVKGANFGLWAPSASPVSPVSCVAGRPSYDYATGVLAFTDTSGSWSAGAPGDCTGLIVRSWSDSQVVLGFGSAYVWPLLQTGDHYQVSLLGTTYSGISTTPAVPAPAITSVFATGLGTSTSPTVTINGSNFGTRVPVHSPLTPPGCTSGDTSYDFTTDQLFVNDEKAGWTAGEPGDCIGLIVSTWTPTKIILTLGPSYPGNAVVGDDLRVGVFDTVFAGTLLAMPPPTVSGLTVSSKAAVVTVTGTGFGAAPPPSTLAGCVAGDPGRVFPKGQLAVGDTTHSWQAGAPGDCIGLTVTSWTNKKVVIGFGTFLSNFTLAKGDQIQVEIEGTTVTGTAG